MHNRVLLPFFFFLSAPGSTSIYNTASETGHYYGLWQMLEPLLEETVEHLKQ